MSIDNILPDGYTQTEQEPEHPASPMQLDIYDATTELTDNLSIEAVAGSGKTTTILKAMTMVEGSCLFLAFNKSIADELAAKVPMGAEARTFNSLGHRLLMSRIHGSKLEKWKLPNAARSMLSSTEYREWGNELVKCIGSIKSAGMGVDMPILLQDFKEVVEYSEIPMDRIDYATDRLCDLWDKAIDVGQQFTFDDQLYMPCYWDLEFPTYDNVFVDEAQDLNNIQHIMLSRLADKGARIFAVGDSRQAIYGFRGALTDSMQRLNSQFQCLELPLSVCYRCDKKIVELAQEIVPQIQYREGAADGKILTKYDGVHPEEIPDGSIVMCRTNAPIFRYGLQFLKHRIPCQMMSNFGEQLIKFVKGLESAKTGGMIREIEAWRDKEIREAEQKELYHKINRINDKADSLLPFCEEFDLKQQVVEALERLLRSKNGPRLCTIHKAKGLEADTAFLLCPGLVPAPWIEEGTEEYEQEINLRYVAITRAAHTLVFMEEFEED